MIPLIIALLMLVFAVTHSLFADGRVKRAASRRWGARTSEGIYRALYNLLALLLLAPIGALIALVPGSVLWRAEGSLAWGMAALMGAGILGIGVSILQIDGGRFAGITQLHALLRHEALPLPDEPLQARGLYRHVRHPLYLFSLIALWSQPTMTEAGLIFAVSATLYFIVGSRIEERRLIAQYGDVYRLYQRQTPWLVPKLRRRGQSM